SSETISVWLLGIGQGVASRLTFGVGDFTPVWSPDGRRITFASNREGRMNLYWKASTGESDEDPLVKSNVPKFPFSWSNDGHLIVYGSLDPNTRWDLWVVPTSGDHQPVPFLQTPSNERRGQLSPNGRWMAYVSDETGRDEIFVRPFPPAAGKW